MVFISVGKKRSIFSPPRRPLSIPATVHLGHYEQLSRTGRRRPPSIPAITRRSRCPAVQPRTAVPHAVLPRAALPGAAASAAAVRHGAVLGAAMSSPARPCPGHSPPDPLLVSVLGRKCATTYSRPPRGSPSRRCHGCPPRRRPRRGYAFPCKAVSRASSS